MTWCQYSKNITWLHDTDQPRMRECTIWPLPSPGRHRYPKSMYRDVKKTVTTEPNIIMLSTDVPRPGSRHRHFAQWPQCQFKLLARSVKCTTASQHYNLRCTVHLHITDNYQHAQATSPMATSSHVYCTKIVIELSSQCHYLLFTLILLGLSLLWQQCVLSLLILKKWMNEWMHQVLHG